MKTKPIVLMLLLPLLMSYITALVGMFLVGRVRNQDRTCLYQKEGMILLLIMLIASRTFDPIGEPATNCEMPNLRS